MSINEESLRLLTELRVTVDQVVDAETKALIRSWARAWDQISAEWEATAADLAQLQADGQPISPALVRRHERARRAALAAHDQLIALVNRSAARMATATGEVVDLTRIIDARLTATQLPATAGSNATVTARFTRVSDLALAAIVERTTEQITSRAWPLADDATESMLRELTRATARGLSPREAGRRMVRGVEGRFNGGLTRAVTIARTELLDASRTAAAQNQAGNADVLAGWMWLAHLDSSTCPACVAMHGTLHQLEEPGPIGHQNCRCDRMPVTKSWQELGFSGMMEPSSTVTSGEDWFWSQPESVQTKIMGATRMQALNDGVPFAELVSRRSTPGWRDSLVPTPAGELVA